MQWEHDEEEDEIQVYKTSRIPEHYQGRSSIIPQRRGKELPNEDSFSKRLGQRSKSTIRERTLERANASLTTSNTADAPRRTLFHDIPRTCKYQPMYLFGGLRNEWIERVSSGTNRFLVSLGSREQCKLDYETLKSVVLLRLPRYNYCYTKIDSG